jgi:hypothetical protein
MSESVRTKNVASPIEKEAKRFALERELYELRAENVNLRKALELGEVPYTLEAWMAIGSQGTRDAFAARALVSEWGHHAKALQRLGFQVISDGKWKVDHVAYLAERIFETPGVKAEMEAHLGDHDEAWTKIVARQREIAVTGSPESAQRSAHLIAKLEGRFKDQPASVPTVSLQVLVQRASGQPEPKIVSGDTIEAHDPLAMLAHEPSEVGGAIETGDKLAVE